MSHNKIGPKELAVRALRESRLTSPVKKPTKPANEDSMPKAKAKAKPKADTEANGSKKQIVATLLTRKAGCTGRDVKDATGWPSVSIPAMAKACGLTLRKEKTDKGFRYYGTAR